MLDNPLEFQRGDLLKAIYWPSGTEVVVGQVGVTRIEVVMENGQMDTVPWANVFHEDTIISKINLALVQVVNILQPEGAPNATTPD